MWKSFLLLSLTAFTFSCSNSNSDQNKKLVVKTTTVQTVESEQTNHFSFISKPHRTTNLSFRVGGPVEKFNVYSGNYFPQGSVIAQIDARDFTIRKERAEGQYLQAKAEYERIKVLYEKSNLSASTYDKAHADVIAAKAAYDMAQNELTDTKLIAPFNGYIEQLFIEQHQDVKAAQNIVSFVDIDQIRIELFVNQEIALRAKSITDIQLTFDALPGKSYQAKVIDISKSTTSNNLSYLLTALLPNSDRSLLPGMSGKVCFDSNNKESLITIPLTALLHRPTEGNFVWAIDPASGLVTKRTVTLGKALPNGNITIATGLKQGEQIAISGLRFLSDGMVVKTEQ
ncbi:MAG: efflux RND transporter periplasmic adaptor subunit [Phocaeicola sp.]